MQLSTTVIRSNNLYRIHFIVVLSLILCLSNNLSVKYKSIKVYTHCSRIHCWYRLFYLIKVVLNEFKKHMTWRETTCKELQLPL